MCVRNLINRKQVLYLYLNALYIKCYYDHSITDEVYNLKSNRVYKLLNSLTDALQTLDL